MRWDKENLAEAVSQSKSVSDVCKALGITASASNYRTFKKYRDLHEIDCSHFVSGGYAFHKKKALSNEEVFVENSTYAQAPLRKRVVKQQLLEYKCSTCRNDGRWQGEKLSLQLDHINGINNDHRLTNLRWLCPNCHSQTPTYVGRNK